jgi:hypothetical protein
MRPSEHRPAKIEQTIAVAASKSAFLAKVGDPL